jgi:hypothetical protein
MHLFAASHVWFFPPEVVNKIPRLRSADGTRSDGFWIQQQVARLLLLLALMTHLLPELSVFVLPHLLAPLFDYSGHVLFSFRATILTIFNMKGK